MCSNVLVNYLLYGLKYSIILKSPIYNYILDISDLEDDRVDAT